MAKMIRQAPTLIAPVQAVWKDSLHLLWMSDAVVLVLIGCLVLVYLVHGLQHGAEIFCYSSL